MLSRYLRAYPKLGVCLYYGISEIERNPRLTFFCYVFSDDPEARKVLALHTVYRNPPRESASIPGASEVSIQNHTFGTLKIRFDTFQSWTIIFPVQIVYFGPFTPRELFPNNSAKFPIIPDVISGRSDILSVLPRFNVLYGADWPILCYSEGRPAF